MRGDAPEEADRKGSLGRIAGLAAIVAFAIGIVSAVLFMAAADFDIRAFFEPARLLTSGSASRATLLHWGALTDLLSYYLPLIPLFLWSGARIRPRAGTRADLAAVCGVVYAGIGAVAAGVLAAVGPPLLDEAARTTGAGHHQVVVLFTALTNGVYLGAWQTVEVLPLAAWALIAGVAFRRDHKAIGGIGVALAAACLGSSATRMVGGHPPEALLIAAAVVFAGLFWLFVLGLAWEALRPAPAVGGR